jgi:hypothetical protein
MADPAALASITTGATAVLSGLVGYGTARGQRTLELSRLARDEREAVSAREEASLRERTELYLACVRSIDAWIGIGLRAIGTRKVKPDDVIAWWNQYQAASSAVQILGAEGVRKAMGPMGACLVAIYDDIDWDAADFDVEVNRVYAKPKHFEGFDEHRDAVVDAIRADVGPHSGARKRTGD